MSPSLTEATRGLPDRPPGRLHAWRPDRLAQTLSAGLPRWRGRAAVHDLFVHAQGVWQPAAAVDAVPAGQAFTNLADWIEQHAGEDCRLVFSAALTHSLVLRDADLPLFDDAALAAYVRQQFGLVHGAVAEHWPLAVWSDWPVQVACALHGLDWPALQLLARQQSVRLRLARPWWALAWRQAHRSAAWAAQPRRALLLLEGRLATWLVGDADGLQSLRLRRLAQPTLADAGGLLHALQQAEQLDAASTLVAGCGLQHDPVGSLTLPATVVGPLHRAWPDLAGIAP